MAAAARSSRRRAARARDTCAHGRPEPCAALGGLSLSPLLSASRSSASLQSLSDAVMDASSASSAWPSAPRDAPRARSRARVHDASLTSGSSIATAGPRAARWTAPRRSDRASACTTIARRSKCPVRLRWSARLGPIPRRPVAGRGQTGKYLTETDFRLTAPPYSFEYGSNLLQDISDFPRRTHEQTDSRDGANTSKRTAVLANY